MKKVLIIYDTLFGNTRKLALEIASGIQMHEDISTQVTHAKELESEDLSEYAGILFGGPTRAFRATRGAMNSIKWAIKRGLDGKVVSTFGTYMVGDQSRGVQGMDKRLRQDMLDAKVLAPGFSAKVDGPRGPIATGEIPRAQEWGHAFGQSLLTMQDQG